MSDQNSVTVTVGATVAVAQYENVKIEFGETVHVSSEFSTEDIRKKLAEELLDDLAEKIRDIREVNW